MTITKTVTNPYPSKDKTTTTFAEGKTLRVWQGSVQVMSDVWEMSMFAEYWDDATQSVQTESWLERATVDAPPDVVAKAEAWLYARSYDAAFQKKKALEEQEARHRHRLTAQPVALAQPAVPDQQSGTCRQTPVANQ